MSTFGSRRSRRMKNDINVVPYIDVMLVLLVIFMVTAPMITPGQIELPSVGTASDVPVQPIEVQIDAQGALALRVREGGASFRPIDKANLLAEIRAVATADTPVVISADGKVPYESVMQVMDQLRNGGIGKLGLLVNQNAPAAR
ncbi:ExbD/TolR family protein [Castellaniella defragrans]|uniref:Tol biopolymer transport system, TolR protein n=2 Tax=Castellaniella defragrans TaxID=75697 RepID=W8X643_CASD6|nr:ExbD/TolR family protein [Castellaniella defragrans]MBB6084609.1 biopolymer transport protein TolR [Castellaniella defragrans]CDM25816.1 Tol biopolymer transport system, TolR protein [Castellaniella defragrans 65Phen]